MVVHPLCFLAFPAFVLLLGSQVCAEDSVRYEGPIIDMHLHAETEIWSDRRPCKPAPCTDTPTMAQRSEDLKRMTIEAMKRNNIVLGVFSQTPAKVLPWTEGESNMLTGISVRVPDEIPLAELRNYFTSGRAQVLGEITSQYAGIPIDDPSMDGLFAMAHQLDLPVHVHVLGGGGSPDFPVHLGNPLRIVPVLRKYPGLRIQMENAGWPFLEEITAVMTQFPNVYADYSTILSHRPRSVALKYLKGLYENGLGKRIMFGSDQMIWPETIDIAVDVIQSADFLSTEEKADIFYNNAARYLKLSDDQMQRHHEIVH